MNSKQVTVTLSELEPHNIVSGENNYIRVANTGVLLVSISDNPEAIPLKDLTNKLENYLNAYGGQGNLRIQIVYKDENGDFKDWKPFLKENI